MFIYHLWITFFDKILNKFIKNINNYIPLLTYFVFSFYVCTQLCYNYIYPMYLASMLIFMLSVFLALSWLKIDILAIVKFSVKNWIFEYLDILLLYHKFKNNWKNKLTNKKKCYIINSLLYKLWKDFITHFIINYWVY